MYPEGHRASGTPGTPRCRDPPNPCLSFPLWQHLPPAPPPPPTLLRAAPAPEGLKAEGVAGGELPEPPAAIKLPLSGSPAGCGGVSPFPRHTMAHCPRYCPGSPSLAAPGTSPPTPPPPPITSLTGKLRHGAPTMSGQHPRHPGIPPSPRDGANPGVGAPRAHPGALWVPDVGGPGVLRPPPRAGRGAGGGDGLGAGRLGPSSGPSSRPAGSRRRRPLPAGEWGRAGGAAPGRAPLISHPRVLLVPIAPPRPDPRPRGAGGERAPHGDTGCSGSRWGAGDPVGPGRDVGCWGGGQENGVPGGPWGARQGRGVPVGCRQDAWCLRNSVRTWGVQQKRGVPVGPCKDVGCWGGGGKWPGEWGGQGTLGDPTGMWGSRGTLGCPADRMVPVEPREDVGCPGDPRGAQQGHGVPGGDPVGPSRDVGC